MVMNWMPMKMSSTASSSSGRLARATPYSWRCTVSTRAMSTPSREETTPTVPNTCSGRVA